MKKHILTLFLLFFLLAGVQSAFGIYYWRGTSFGGDGTHWDVAANWSTSPSGGVVATNWPGNASGSPVTTGVTVNFNQGAAALSFLATQTVSLLSLNIGQNTGLSVILNTGASTITCTSSITISNASNFFVNSSNIICSGTFSVNGVFRALSSSSISVVNLTVNKHSGGYQCIVDNSTLSNSGSLNNYDVFTLQNNGTITTAGSGALNNKATGVFNATGTSSITLNGGFDNLGTFTMTSSTMTNGNSTMTNDLGGTLSFSNSTLNIAGAGSFNNYATLNVTAGSILNLTDVGTLNNEPSTGTYSLTGSTINFGAATNLLNENTVTANTTTFNLIGNGTANGGAFIQNDNSFSSTSCIFNLGLVSTDEDTYISNTNNAATVFTDNGSTFNAIGSITGSSASPNVSSINNDGTFFALSGSKFVLTGTNTQIVNGSVASSTGGICYFVLGAKSAILMGSSGSGTNGTGSEVYNGPTFGQFILNSDANNSATIINYNLSNNNGITGGQYFVQRFITGGSNSYRGYRLLTSPVNNGSNLIDLFYLNATFTPGYTGAPTYYGIDTFGGSGFSNPSPLGNPLMYLYNETINPTQPLYSYTSGKNVGVTSITSGTSLGWVSTASGATPSGTATLAPTNGFLLYYLGSTLRGSSTSTGILPDNSTITFQGYINQGDVPVSLWYTPGGGGTGLSYSAGVYSAGFNMVGNPYTSTIDLNLVSYYNTTIGVGTNTYNTYYELDDISKQYYSYIPSNGNPGGGGTTSGGNVSEYVASGQGFFVYVTAASQTLTFKENQKVYNTSLLTSPNGLLVAKNDQTSGLNGSLASSATTRAIIQGPENELAGLHLKLKLDSADYGETGIYFSKKGIDKYDHNDAVYLPGIGTKLSFSSFTADGVNVGINSMSNYIKGKRIKLDVESSTDGVFTISLSDIANIDPSIFNVYIIDNLKKDSVDLVQYNKISFNISVADASTYGPNRFVLAVERKPLGAYQLVTLKGAKANGGVTVTWKTNNEGDFTGFGLQKLDPTTSTYSTVDSLQSNGSGSYTYDDPATITGVNTYRLEQNDIDGNVTYSKPISVNYSLVASPGALSVYPNPVKDAMILDFSGITSANADSYNIEIYNSLGILMIQKASTSNSVTEDVSTLRPGVYVVSVKTNSGNPVGNATFVKNQ